MFQVRKVPAVLHYIVKTTLCRPVFLKRVVARQTIHNEVIGTTEMYSVFHHLRFMSLEPAPLGINILLVGSATSNIEKFLQINRRTQLLNFSNSSCIILLDARAEWYARCIHNDHSGYHTRNADSLD